MTQEGRLVGEQGEFHIEKGTGGPRSGEKIPVAGGCVDSLKGSGGEAISLDFRAVMQK